MRKNICPVLRFPARFFFPLNCGLIFQIIKQTHLSEHVFLFKKKKKSFEDSYPLTESAFLVCPDTLDALGPGIRQEVIHTTKCHRLFTTLYPLGVERKQKFTFLFVFKHILGNVYVCQLLSHVQLFATLWTVAHLALLSLGFPKQEYWSGLPCPPPGDLPNQEIEPRSSMLEADSLPSELTGKLDVGSISQ